MRYICIFAPTPRSFRSGGGRTRIQLHLRTVAPSCRTCCTSISWSGPCRRFSSGTRWCRAPCSACTPAVAQKQNEARANKDKQKRTFAFRVFAFFFCATGCVLLPSPTAVSAAAFAISTADSVDPASASAAAFSFTHPASAPGLALAEGVICIEADDAQLADGALLPSAAGFAGEEIHAADVNHPICGHLQLRNEAGLCDARAGARGAIAAASAALMLYT